MPHARVSGAAGLLLSGTQLHSSEEFTAPEDTVIKVKHTSVRYAAQFSVLDKILLRYSLILSRLLRSPCVVTRVDLKLSTNSELVSTESQSNAMPIELQEDQN